MKKGEYLPPLPPRDQPIPDGIKFRLIRWGVGIEQPEIARATDYSTAHVAVMELGRVSISQEYRDGFLNYIGITPREFEEFPRYRLEIFAERGSPSIRRRTR